MPRMMFDFVDGATGRESGERLNRSAIEQVRLLPRILVDIEERGLGKRFLGRDMGLPFGIAPMGMCALAWPGADRMLASEAVRREIPICLSTAASTSLALALLNSGRRVGSSAPSSCVASPTVWKLV